MAILRGVNNTKQANDPVEKIQAGEERARMRVSYDEFDAPGAIAINDTIKLSKIPKGALVHNVVLAHDDLGTTGVLDLGWDASDDGVEAADPDGFLVGADVNALADIKSMHENALVPGMNKRFDAEVQISALATTATTAAGKIRVAVYYSTD